MTLFAHVLRLGSEIEVHVYNAFPGQYSPLFIHEADIVVCLRRIEPYKQRRSPPFGCA